MKKILMIFVFLLTSFFIGLNFEKLKVYFNNFFNKNSKDCTLEAKLCPDGSSVGRVPPNCDFAPCPTVNKNKKEIDEYLVCGGIMGKRCPEGYFCIFDNDHPLRSPDMMGKCVKENVKEKIKDKFECPKNGYIDCMPGPDFDKKYQCNSLYIEWAKKNCPGFRVVY